MTTLPTRPVRLWVGRAREHSRYRSSTRARGLATMGEGYTVLIRCRRSRQWVSARCNEWKRGAFLVMRESQCGCKSASHRVCAPLRLSPVIRHRVARSSQRSLFPGRWLAVALVRRSAGLLERWSAGTLGYSVLPMGPPWCAGLRRERPFLGPVLAVGALHRKGEHKPISTQIVPG